MFIQKVFEGTVALIILSAFIVPRRSCGEQSHQTFIQKLQFRRWAIWHGEAKNCGADPMQSSVQGCIRNELMPSFLLMRRRWGNLIEEIYISRDLTYDIFTYFRTTRAFLRFIDTATTSTFILLDSKMRNPGATSSLINTP